MGLIGGVLTPSGAPLGQGLEDATLQLLRGMTVSLGTAEGLEEVPLELGPGVARLADLEVKAYPLLGHVVQLAVQVLEQPGHGLVARDHPFGGAAAGAPRKPEQSLQPIECSHLAIPNRLGDVSHLDGICVESLLELPSASEQSTLHCPDRNLHDFGNLVVGKVL